MFILESQQNQVLQINIASNISDLFKLIELTLIFCIPANGEV